MKKNVLLFLSPLLLLCFLVVQKPQFFGDAPEATAPALVTSPKYKTTEPAQEATAPGLQEQLVGYAMSLKGTPYVYAGMSRDGFDCSGFTTHVFAQYDIKIPHSSKMQAQQGSPVAKAEARPGDLVIFTGTNPDVREPGHVGIVISQPGDTIAFVHSSSNGGVKVSEIEGTRYDLRFLEVRRVI